LHWLLNKSMRFQSDSTLPCNFALLNSRCTHHSLSLDFASQTIIYSVYSYFPLKCQPSLDPEIFLLCVCFNSEFPSRFSFIFWQWNASNWIQYPGFWKRFPWVSNNKDLASDLKIRLFRVNSQLYPFKVLPQLFLDLWGGLFPLKGLSTWCCFCDILTLPVDFNLLKFSAFLYTFS
jgi:hypothetical protein